MPKTQYAPGVVVTSRWLNGARQLFFDGIDEDWHYDPLTTSDIKRIGDKGFDNLYVTRETFQQISGNKTFDGDVKFGDSESSDPDNSPKAYSTNAKFNRGGENRLFSQKWQNLDEYDLITKRIMTERIKDFPEIDEGTF